MNTQAVDLDTLKYLLGIFAGAGSFFGCWVWQRLNRLEERHDLLAEYVYKNGFTKEDAMNAEMRLIAFFKKNKGGNNEQ